MTIRPLRHSDLRQLRDIADVITATEYVHVDRVGDGIDTQWRLVLRPVRQPLQLAQGLPEDLAFSLRMLAGAAEDDASAGAEGIALVAEYDGRLIALAAGETDAARGVLRVLTVRVDEDFRRQGIGLGLAFKLQEWARDHALRALSATTSTANPAAAHFLVKAGYQLAGLDTARESNHDLVKEQVTLLWNHPLD